MKTNPKLAYAIMAALAAPAGAALAADATNSFGIEEIVVTAQRRSESLQNVPITIQAISSDSLSKLNISTFDDVIKMLPNVTFGTNGPGQGNIFMRGLSAGFAGGQSSASIAPFPNVATYLDDQSLTFPARNLDVYMVDMERVEVLEGPQGTLFGGGAEAGAIRYITNKPKLNVTEGRAEAGYGTTAHGDANTSLTAVLNLPLITDKLAVRGVFYNDHRGGYIDNVGTTFTRNPAVDTGPNAYSSSYPAHLDTYNNYGIAKRAQNPVSYQGMRLSALYQINDDWSALIQQSYQNMDAEGISAQMPIGIGLTNLQPLEETSFMPAWNKDKATSTAWALNGKFGDLKAVYTGSYMSRHVDQNMDYTNYARTPGGFYYSCVGGGGSNFGGSGPAACYSPVMGWHDTIQSTHQSHEFRLSTPDDWRLRGLIGAFWEDFQIKDSMDFMQKGIPSCTPANLMAALDGGPLCLANVTPVNAAINPNTRNDSVNFGEDLQRGYKQTAVFASLDYDIIPKVLTATVGARYYKYTENEVGSQYSTGGGCVNVPNGDCLATPIGGGLDPNPVTGVRDSELHTAKYTGVKSRANITWHPTDDTMVYYTFSQGYRPGAFNRTTKGVTKIWVDADGAALANGVLASTVTGAHQVKQYVKPLSYSPDTLVNNEVGFKTEFLSHRLQINGSLYQMDWKDVQTLIYNPPVFGNTTFGVNGGTYRVKGLELQITARVTEGLTLMASMSDNDAKQSSSPCIRSSGVTLYTPGNPTPAGQCINQVRIGGTNVATPDPLGSVGDTPAFSPKIQFNLRARYDWTSGDYKAFAMAGMNHVDSMNNTPSSFPSGEGILIPTTTWLRYNMPSYNTYDATFGVSKDAWDVQVYGQNLSNENASTFTSSGQFIKAEVPLRPRVLGIKIGMKF
ncbi:MAG: TonB-dependent receptor [Pseudomonadota bacterium]